MTTEDMVQIDATRQPVVSAKDGEVFADSRDVAAFFQKRHDHVIRDIRLLISKEPKLGLTNFGEFKNKDLTGEHTTHYDMDRRGFTLLAMGFTGDKALKWKLRYIDAFDAMEAELRRRTSLLPDYTDPAVLLGCFQALQARVSEKDEIIGKLAPKAEALDVIAESYGSFNRTVAAKNLQIPPQQLIRWMRTHGWTYRRPGDADDLAYQSKIAVGLLEHKVTTGLREDGTQWTRTQVRVTPKGLTVLAKAFPPPLREV
jgi:Rha family phage regulatory protein